MRLKICGGEFKGRFIHAPKVATTRPTSERLRQTLFNILGPRTEGATFLDAYAGSGAIGIEALSRGASKSYFIEMNKSAAHVLKENLASLDISSNSAVLLSHDCHRAIHLLPKNTIDIAYLDPPYAKTLAELNALHHLLKEMQAQEIFQHEALLFLEMGFHTSQINLDDLPCYEFLKSRKIGDTCLHEYLVKISPDIYTQTGSRGPK